MLATNFQKVAEESQNEERIKQLSFSALEINSFVLIPIDAKYFCLYLMLLMNLSVATLGGRHLKSCTLPWIMQLVVPWDPYLK